MYFFQCLKHIVYVPYRFSSDVKDNKNMAEQERNVSFIIQVRFSIALPVQRERTSVVSGLESRNFTIYHALSRIGFAVTRSSSSSGFEIESGSWINLRLLLCVSRNARVTLYTEIRQQILSIVYKWSVSRSLSLSIFVKFQWIMLTNK